MFSRQYKDVAKIITLDVWVRGLQPNHSYLLQRAVDTNLDGNCTSTGWLTLGKGLTPQSILTNDEGKGQEDLWRDVSAVVAVQLLTSISRLLMKLPRQ